MHRSKTIAKNLNTSAEEIIPEEISKSLNHASDYLKPLTNLSAIKEEEEEKKQVNKASSASPLASQNNQNKR